MNGGVLSKREDKGIDGGVFGKKTVEEWNVFRDNKNGYGETFGP